jgi:hypothetical protein
MSDVKHFVRVNDQGVPEFENIVRWKQECFNNRDRRCYVTMKRVVKRRSVNQNAYFHAIVHDYIAPQMGETDEDCKEVLKYHFLRRQLPNGMVFVRPTSSLSTVEFLEFCANCRMLASQMGWGYVPSENEIEY